MANRHPCPASPSLRPHSDETSGASDTAAAEEPLSWDLVLPKEDVLRIMKKGLPHIATIDSGSAEFVQKCVSEFIHMIAGEAADKGQTDDMNTITGEDVLRAMESLGFTNYVKPLELYLCKFQEIERKKTFSAEQGDHWHSKRRQRESVVDGDELAASVLCYCNRAALQ